MIRTFAFSFVSAMVLAIGSAAAHGLTGAGDGGFGAGFVHPFLGLDHVLAMVAVGLWAAHLGGRARLWVPTAFLAAMVIGGAAGAVGAAVPFVETAIAVSVLALGVLLTGSVRAPVTVAAAITALFAVFHGYAHGSEVPAEASPAVAALGFVLATALLHGLGLAAGMLREPRRAALLRLAGGGVAAAGLLLLVL